MPMRKFLNALLLVMIVVLIWVTTQAPNKKNQDAEIPVFDQTLIDATGITQIRLQHPQRDEITLRLIDQQWWLKTPLVVRANAPQVEALKRIVTVTSRNGFRAEGNDLSQYGLAPPRLILWLNDQRLDIGAREPLSGQRYVSQGDQVHLIDDDWSSYLFAGAYEYVSPRLLPADATVVRLQLVDARWDYQNGNWRRQPETAGPGNIGGAALAKAWSQASALLVQSLNPALPWQGNLRIGLRGSLPALRFEFTETATGLYLARRDLGVQYLLPTSRADLLLGRDNRAD